MRRRLEVEKEELAVRCRKINYFKTFLPKFQHALEDLEAMLEQEENKNARLTLEVQQTRQEVDKRVAEKMEEFENTKKTYERQMESMQVE
jgi:chromosome segregation ATPase